MLDPKLKIIIVDDFKTIRLQITKMLNNLGFTETFEAEDGNDAWIKIMEADAISEPFSLIIADINMPNMTGIELLKKVRDQYGQLPFIIISAENEKKAILKTLELKVDNFIIKPITESILKDRILKALIK